MCEKERSKRCFITDADRCRLGSLLTSRERRMWGRARNIRILDTRLEDAEPVADCKAPQGLVTMNSTVELLDLDSGNRRLVTLAYPEDYEFLPDAVSVLDPLGTGLLGSEVGDTVCPDSRQFQITRIVYQPEAVGAMHL
jgi:regulator of nucleoside diphosphate kinase